MTTTLTPPRVEVEPIHQWLDLDRAARVRTHLRATYHPKPNKIDQSVHRDLQPGWLWVYLFEGHGVTWQRWQYWNHVAEYTACYDRLPPEPIPPLDLQDVYVNSGDGRGETLKMLERSLEAIAPSWHGWSSWDAFEFFLQWLLHGMDPRGKHEAPRREFEGASDRLYQAFNLDLMLLWPADYWGYLFAEARVGRSAGFYPTPQAVSNLMADMLMVDVKDARLETMNEPAISTGRLALASASHCLTITGQDINPLCILACEVNAWLYAPWMAVPLRWVWQRTMSGKSEIQIEQPIAVGKRMEHAVERGQVVLL